MIIRIFSRPVFSFQLNLNNTDEETVIMRTPIIIISIDKIINTFISSPFFHHTFISPAKLMLQNNKPRTTIPKSFFMNQDPSTELVHTQFTISFKLLTFAKSTLLLYKDSRS